MTAAWTTDRDGTLGRSVPADLDSSWLPDPASMTEDEVLRVTREHLESMVPRRCTTCGRGFASLREYLADTTPVGSAIPYDAVAGNWTPAKPIGALGYANCSCGTTLTLSTAEMPLPLLWELLEWIKATCAERGVSPVELVDSLRRRIREQVLSG